MRVLHVIDGIGVGGAELVLIQLVERLEAQGVRNTILSLTPAGILRDRLIASGADLVEMKMTTGRLPWGSLRALVRAMRAARPDVIQGWMYHGNFAAMVLRDLALMRRPMLWSIHNTLEPKPPFSAVTRLAFGACRLMSFRPKFIVHVSQAAARQHAAAGFGASKAVVIPNGTDCGRFRASAGMREEVRAQLGLGDDVFVLGCFARWAPMKGHANLFEAVARLKAQGLKPHLLLAGTLMEVTNPELSALMRAAGVETDCTCLGERRDVDSLLTALDGLVLPSIHGEAFPMILGEAMACEIPCVATDVGDSALLLGDTGFIVPPADVGALTSALARLMRMAPEERASLGAAACLRVRERFSMDAMVSAYLDLYRSSSGVRGAALVKDGGAGGDDAAGINPVPPAARDAGADGLPRLGVVMPCRNEEAMIRRSVASVLAFDYPADRMTLTVVDGMSTDATRAIVDEIAAADPRVRLLGNPEYLPAPAMNRAIDSLDCEIVLRVDAHTVYPPDYASRSVAALVETGAQNAGGVIVTVPGADTPEARAIAFSLSHPFGVGNASFRTGSRERRWTDTVPFGCWRLSTLRDMGGFATDIPYGEDDELNGRLMAAGGRILLDPAIVSEYAARATLGKFMLMLYRYGRSKPATAARLGRVTTLRQLVPPVFVLVTAGSLLLALVWPPVLLVGLAALVAHLAAGAMVAAKARASGRLDLRSALRLPHTLLAGHVAYGMGYVRGLLPSFNLRKLRPDVR